MRGARPVVTLVVVLGIVVHLTGVLLLIASLVLFWIRPARLAHQREGEWFLQAFVLKNREINVDWGIKRKERTSDMQWKHQTLFRLGDGRWLAVLSREEGGFTDAGLPVYEYKTVAIHLGLIAMIGGALVALSFVAPRGRVAVVRMYSQAAQGASGAARGMWGLALRAVGRGPAPAGFEVLPGRDARPGERGATRDGALEEKQPSP